MQVLLGCGIGCGILLLVAMGACIGFVTWLSRPGELIEPGRLLDASTVAHAEWTLRLEDPGTEQALLAMLEAVDRSRSVVPILPEAFQEWSRKRDEREMRQIFPMVATWSVRRGATGAPEQLFGVSVPKIGNRIRIADWFLGFVAGRGRDNDLDREEHAGEQIYRLRETGAAFFLRSGAVFIATDVEQAKGAVEALDRGATGVPPEALTSLLAALPEAPLRAVALNEAGACAMILDRLTGEPVDEADLAPVRAITLAGGFTPSAGFEATLTVHSDDPGWGALHAERLAARLGERLGATVTPVDTAAAPLELRIAVDDPSRQVRDRLDRITPRRLGARE
jgi:hypothetical protein